MTMANNKTYIYPAATGLLVFCLIAFKMHMLGLPYFWDEAWPYSAAVRAMYNHGPSLLPNALPPELSRGHPLLFHFLAASWMKLFGTSLVSGHSFALLISVCLIVAVYRFCNRFFSARVAFTASLFLCLQVGFVAQATFVLPEVLMAFWTVVCLYTYFNNNRWLYVLVTTCMLLTKESGIVLPLALCIYDGIGVIKTKDWRGGLRKIFINLLPVFIVAIFFILQKLQYGWFFYPLHLSYISIDKNVITEKIPVCFAYLFIYSGRNVLTLLSLISLGIALWKKKFYQAGKINQVAPLLAIYMLLFILFCSINFFIPRYMLPALPVLAIAAATLIDIALSSISLSIPIAVSAISISLFLPFLSKKKNDDLNCAHAIHTEQNVVKYCEQNHLYDSEIAAPCVVKYDLTEPSAGYLSGPVFAKTEQTISANTSYYIYSSDEPDEATLASLKQMNKITLLKRFEEGYAWREIYKVVK